jgi:hypothetical protein
MRCPLEGFRLHLNLGEAPEFNLFLHVGHLSPKTSGIPHDGQVLPFVMIDMLGMLGKGPIITIIGILMSPLLCRFDYRYYNNYYKCFQSTLHIVELARLSC